MDSTENKFYHDNEESLSNPPFKSTSFHSATHSSTEMNGGTRYCRNLSPGRAPPLPSVGGFRLQPRKSISAHTNSSPARSISSSSRGRKRGAQTLVSTLASSSLGARSTCFPYTEPAAGVGTLSEDETALPALQCGSNIDSPVPMHHALQSMSIKSPTPSTPVSQHTKMQDREQVSPFIVFSPSLKACPYSRQEGQRGESLCSVDSISKLSSSIITTPKLSAKYGSPRKKSYGSSNNNNELLSTPRSCSQTAHLSQTPATPGSVRTLPSPHDTPLPKCMRLTPRSSRRAREDLSSDASIFLSPNEKLGTTSPSEDKIIFSFDRGITPLQQRRPRALSKSSSYVPSPFSCSETEGGSLRVETRSLLGPQDSSSVLDIMLSANARAAAIDCDGSLSDDDSHEPFVLANPTILAQERDELRMPPPRPSRRRRMSPDSKLGSTGESEIDSLDTGCDAATLGIINVTIEQDDAANEELVPSPDSSRHSPSIKMLSRKSRYDHSYSGRLEPIESCCSLVGLGLTESSSIIDNNERPETPPTVMEAAVDYKSPFSKASVRISRSDASNVHMTIASMAGVHGDQHSPSLMTCSS